MIKMMTQRSRRQAKMESIMIPKREIKMEMIRRMERTRRMRRMRMRMKRMRRMRRTRMRRMRMSQMQFLITLGRMP